MSLIISSLVCAAAAAVLPCGAASAAISNYPDRMGTRYTAPPPDLSKSPRIVEIPLPATPRLDAIWGGTGRDATGHIWMGVCDSEGTNGSAHLFEYDPVTKTMVDHGDVVSELKNAGLYRPNESQNKLHTKIIQAEDGYLYFASFDEVGEDPARGIVSKWGGHLWRFRPGSRHWEHIHATREALVAVAGNGHWIYALGYWGHVLFQYDTRKQTWREVKAGSVREHVSRNFVVDARGHAYVPAAREWDANHVKSPTDGAFSADLVEFDTDLKPIANTPLTHYTDDSHDSQGLVGFSYLANGSIIVTTHVGYVYRIVPPAGGGPGPAKVEAIGPVDPAGASYPGSLFPIDGDRYLAGVVQTSKGMRWFTYDLVSRKAELQILPFNGRDLLLYGSSTRDDRGRFYVVGRQRRDASGNKPVVLQVEQPN